MDMLEPHFSPRQLAEKWSLSAKTITRLFRHEPGVVRLRRSLRIPVSVAERVYRSRQQQPTPRRQMVRVKHAKDGSLIVIPR